MIWNGVKAASNQAKERIDRKLLASFGSNNRHGNPRHVDIKSSLGGGHCRIDLYEKATERSGWLLGCVTLRELLPWRSPPIMLQVARATPARVYRAIGQ